MPETNTTVPYRNTYWVVPSRLLAGEHPSDFDEATARTRLSALLETGIRTFVDLTEEHELDGYHQMLRGLAEERRLDTTYLRIPIPDRSTPSLWTVKCILNVLDRSVTDEQPAYVHCFAGIGRTGTVIGCYLQRHGLATRGDVIEKIAGLRSLMPFGSEPSPHTPDQVRMVEHWPAGA